MEQLRNKAENLWNDPDHWQHIGPIRVFALVFFPPLIIKCDSAGHLYKNVLLDFIQLK